MRTSVRTLLDGIIDYAGLFPPARLAMADAVAEFERHRGEAEGWMLARFVCPATRLDELSPLLDAVERSFPLSILGRGGDTAAGFAEGTAADLAAIDALVAAHVERVVVDQFEVRLPAAAGPEPVVRDALTILAGGSVEMTAFFESSLLGDWRDRLAGAVRAVAAVVDDSEAAGFKIRCGGVAADHIPGADAVAEAVAECARARVPLKATQGLHHPVRHFDRELGALTHGFLNLFVAGVLADAHGLIEKDLLPIIEEQEADAFDFSENGIAWRDLTADIAQVAAARSTAMTGFGSCSFAEPRDDLVNLDLLKSGG